MFNKCGMKGGQCYKMNEEDIDQEMYNEMQDLQNDDGQDSQEDQFINQQEFQEAYGAPEPEERHNQHTFISKSLHFEEPENIHL